MPTLTVSYSIPYTCQFASQELVRQFIHGKIPLEQDTRWAEYGTASPQEYAHWALRSCGVVCVKMAVEGITGHVTGTVMDWVQVGLSLDGYINKQRADRPAEVGWKHATLARLAVERGCQAETAADLTLDDLARLIRADCVVIASVTSELGEEYCPLTRRSGHLVVVYGLALSKSGGVDGIILHNPSGRTPALQAGAMIPAKRFVDGFSGRGIVVGAR
ncbi:MAG: hypothetical protein JXB07_15155 [Anaerolineae bacterium]|nr:hypothetical protein [Anaerolineae bacterium]